MYCQKCGEELEGDGYRTIVRCPNSDDPEIDYMAPDEGPVFCDYEDVPNEEAD